MKIFIPNLALAIALLIVAFAGNAAAEGPPPLPHYFYGAVSVEGGPAPAGTTIEARVDGVLKGSFNPIQTVEAGKYGSADSTADAPRLLVQGDIEDGALVEFLVNGVKAHQTARWRAGRAEVLDLTVTTSSTRDPLALPLSGWPLAAGIVAVLAVAGLGANSWLTARRRR